MNYILKDFISTKEYQNLIREDDRYPVTISGLVDVAKSMLACALVMDQKEKVVIVTYNELQAKNLLKDIQYFTDRVEFFPKREISIYDYDAESNEIELERIKILHQIRDGKLPIVVTTIEAVMQSMVSKNSLYTNEIKVSKGQEIDVAKIKQQLESLGYEKVDLVENQAQFSVRGDIIDVSISDKEGIRIELWGDEIEEIRRFKISDQRSIEKNDKAEILPISEMVLTMPLSVVAARIASTLTEANNKDIEEIQNGNYRNKIDRYFNEFYEDTTNFLDYVSDYKILIDEPEKIKQRIKSIQDDNQNLIKELIEKEKIVPESLLNENEFRLNIEKINNSILMKSADAKQNCFNYVENHTLVDDNFKLLNDEIVRTLNLKNKTIQNINSKNGTIQNINSKNGIIQNINSKNGITQNINSKNEIVQNINSKNKIIILAGSTETRNKLAKIIENSIKVDDLNDIIIKPGQIVVSRGCVTSGFANRETGLLVLSNDDDYTGTSRRRKKKFAVPKFNEGEKIVFADLKVNDLVVHRKYGIGVFTGVRTITVDNITKDFIGIKYRGGDTLYVPTNNLDNVRKYIGGDDTVKLNKLGTKEWENTKARVKGNLRTVAKELIELYAKREKSRGHAFSKDTPWQNEFEETFPYQETDDQLRSIAEVKSDMESSKPMDRLLCGDVGYGKTEVAIRAAFKAVMDGKQVAYLAPTTILASQQYNEFAERMKAYPIKVDLLNRFRTAKQQKETVEKLKNGEVDIVVGTHRLLSKDVAFKDLGLLIIDEEHRFGVKAKEKIKEYKTSVDVLTMTATPIPRTLQMSIVGIRDMSIIYEPPMNRKPVQTYVLEYDTEMIREAIIKELERGGQVFYIFNNVENMSAKVLQLQELVPEAKIDYAHGQMSGAQIEEIMENFIAQKSNVLVCTTILESGIDIPNANTIIVENADRFGLAQLYQIRGRVGRSSKQAYAYITYRKDKMMNEEAAARLKAIKEFTEFGSGFKIATRDLQIRGAGSLFGEVQSGHMEQVGYDMYNRLLNEVVKEMKGEKIEGEGDDNSDEITIDINLSAFIPDSYIESSSQKIEIYQDIANCQNDADVKNIEDEIKDRYGAIPTQVQNLLEIARIKNLCRDKKVIKIQQHANNVVIVMKDFDTSKVDNIARKFAGKVRFSNGMTPGVTLKVENENPVEEIRNFLESL